MGIQTVVNKPTLGKIDFRLTFPKGNYEQAIENYVAAQKWVVETGQWVHPSIDGVIGRPAHSQSPEATRIFPDEMLDDPEWSIAVDVECKTKEAFDWFKSLALPEGVRLEELGSLPDQDFIFCRRCQRVTAIVEDPGGMSCADCGELICVRCGCTETTACEDDWGDPCGWARTGVCTACV